MSSSAINQGVLSAKISNVQNVGDSSAVCSTTGDWSFKNATATATNVFISNAGNVGVGTTSPGAKLEVWKDNVRIGNDVTSGIYGLQWWRAGSERGRVALDASASLLELQADGEMRFLTAGENERMRIDASGTVTVGPISQGYGGLNVTKTGSLSPGVFLWINATATTQKYASFEYNGNGGSGSITPNGTGNVAFNTGPSDYRLKDEVIELSGGLDKIKSLRPVSFVWKKSGETDIGFIAHEIQAVVPECVNGQKDEVDAEGNPVYQSIFPAPAQMIANLVAAIQELSAKVDVQDREIRRLKGEAVEEPVAPAPVIEPAPAPAVEQPAPQPEAQSQSVLQPEEQSAPQPEPEPEVQPEPTVQSEPVAPSEGANTSEV